MPQRAPSVLALILFGPPGSGKGTQANLLMERLGIPHISTGDMLRDHIEKGDAIGEQAATVMRTGSLVSDEMVNALVKQRLTEADCARGFILDGYPRTRQQAETLTRWLATDGVAQVVVHLVVDYNSIIKRLTGRRQCPQCGTLYNLSSRPPKAVGVCDLDGARLVIRNDDSEPVIRERLDAYDRQTRPLIEYFRETGMRLYQVDASGVTPRALLERICESINGQSGARGV
ncbi:MAG: adenylate kinase [Acidobacteria bacterium]|nr:adenylate kinase [Acidobacteriota bacterium]MBI3471624.1 adenylate kinase [Candidatus Solibacter usitatus]